MTSSTSGVTVGVVPPSAVPLGFLTAGGVGLTGFGLAVWFAADRLVVSPFHSGVVSAVHLGVLAFLTTSVLGALHQFGPVVGRRPLRSIFAARLVLVGMVATAWLLPTGFAHGPEWLVAAGGLVGALTVSVAAWNLSGPLSSRSGGVPIVGLRIAVIYLLVTVSFGVVYALNRQAGWFPLYPNRVLAHAHLGLLGWLGVAYVSVSEKLWPMFLLSHRPSNRSGAAAVGLLAGGVLPLALGILLQISALGWLGGALVIAGLIAHISSLASCVRHRRRRLELLHGFLFTSTAFLVVAIGFGTAAAAMDITPLDRVRLVTVEVAALIAWLGLAVIGHAHKVVPFIAYTTLRSRGVRTNRHGRPLLFGDLYRPMPARLALVSTGGGFASLIVGILIGSATVVAIAGVAMALSGVITTANLGFGPRFAVSPSTNEPEPSPAPTPIEA